MATSLDADSPLQELDDLANHAPELRAGAVG